MYQVATCVYINWGQCYLNWDICATYTYLSRWIRATCWVHDGLHIAKWKIFCTLSMKRHALSLYCEIPAADSVDQRNYHRISRNHNFVTIISFFSLFCCLSKDCQEVGGSCLDFSLKLREVILCMTSWTLLKHPSWQDHLRAILIQLLHCL